jgi:hypothetical protein
LPSQAGNSESNLQRTTNAEYVQYLNKADAINQGLIRNVGSQLMLRVDTSSLIDPATGVGRKSVRLRTNKAYNASTLVIADFAHIPANVCGAWPSFWMAGPKWPSDGEIDIIEGVNQMDHNQITIHTKPGCVPTVGAGGQTGKVAPLPADCGAQGGELGCGVNTNRPEAWGSAFNSAGGGVYAMLWASTGIKVWQWKPNEVPADAKGNKPNPNKWGTPVANWNGCNFGQLMDNMNIVSRFISFALWIGLLHLAIRSLTQHSAVTGLVLPTSGTPVLAESCRPIAYTMLLHIQKSTKRYSG